MTALSHSLAAPVMDLAERQRVLRRTRYSHLTESQYKLLIATAIERKLSPWLDHLWVTSIPGPVRNELVVVAKLQALRDIAETSGEYDTQYGPAWCGDDGKWKKFWPKNIPPSAARVGVLRKGRSKPLWCTAYWEESAVVEVDRTGHPMSENGKPVLTRAWERMPRFMLAKVAEAMALRRAFPQELSGLYIAEELPRTSRQRTIEIPAGPEVNASTPETEMSFRMRLASVHEMGMHEANSVVAEYSAKYPDLYGADDRQPFYAAVLYDLNQLRKPKRV